MVLTSIINNKIKKISDFKNVFNFLQTFPEISLYFSILGSLIFQNIWIIGYTIGLLINLVANFILKELIFRPLYGNTKNIPILGRGLRPVGASNCDSYNNCSKKPSLTFGMPSGHSMMIWFTITFIMIYLIAKRFSTNILNNKNNENNEDKESEENSSVSLTNIQFYISVITLIILGILMGYSRVFITKCHTVQQVIVGSILGIGFGYLYTIYVYPLIRDWYNEIITSTEKNNET